MTLCLLLCLLFACTSNSDQNQDQTAYLAGDCDRIGDIRLADECRMFAVRKDPRRAEALCPAQKQPYMQDECWFVRVDAAQLLGEEARQGCQRAGRYAGPCISNALSREITHIKELYPQECDSRVKEILHEYHRPEIDTTAIKLCR